MTRECVSRCFTDCAVVCCCCSGCASSEGELLLILRMAMMCVYDLDDITLNGCVCVCFRVVWRTCATFMRGAHLDGVAFSVE